MLLERGADPNDLFLGSADRPLLWVASQPIGPRDGSVGRSAVRRSGGMPLLKRVWERIMTPAQRRADGADGLLVAVRSDNVPAVEYLLDHGVDVDAERAMPLAPVNLDVFAHVVPPAAPRPAAAEPRQPLLAAAAATGDTALVGLLLRRGAAADARDSRGETPLMVACGGKLGPVEQLIAAGSDLNAADGAGMTPLMHAVVNPDRRERSAIVRLLLTRGADPKARDRRGRSVLDVAMTLPPPPSHWALGPPVPLSVLRMERRAMSRNPQAEIEALLVSAGTRTSR
jgi:hypothetical protein